jgi:Protein of unknown function (DUF1501)
MHRRSFLLSCLAGATVQGVSRAGALPTDKKLVLVFAHGGWDTTRVLSPMFGATVDMEPSAEPWNIGGLSLVDHPARPNVRTFFEQHASRCAVLEGILVPSVAHDTCVQMAMTGGTRGLPDWASVVGGLAADRYTLPNLVLDVPSFPAQFGVSTVRVGATGQLEGLVSGDLVSAADDSPGLLSPAVQGSVDRYLQRRTNARLASAGLGLDASLTTTFADALPRSLSLKGLHNLVSFEVSPSFEDRLDLAVEVLATGVSRAVAMAFPNAYYSWDTHSNNDAGQTGLWNQLFAGLSHLAAALDATPGQSGGPLSDEVVILVISEMGRTPLLNSALGKDHWPYTSALVFGGGTPGGIVIGGYQDNFNGVLTDPVSGQPAAGGIQLTTGHVGASLLALIGEDPGPWTPGIDPLPILVS